MSADENGLAPDTEYCEELANAYPELTVMLDESGAPTAGEVGESLVLVLDRSGNVVLSEVAPAAEDVEAAVLEANGGNW